MEDGSRSRHPLLTGRKFGVKIDTISAGVAQR
jgi:hypothetical protein